MKITQESISELERELEIDHNEAYLSIIQQGLREDYDIHVYAAAKYTEFKDYTYIVQVFTKNTTIYLSSGYKDYGSALKTGLEKAHKYLKKKLQTEKA